MQNVFWDTLLETSSEFISENQGGWKIGVCHNDLRNVPKKMGETRDITKGQNVTSQSLGARFSKVCGFQIPFFPLKIQRTRNANNWRFGSIYCTHRENGGGPLGWRAPSCLTPILEPFKRGLGPINTQYIICFLVFIIKGTIPRVPFFLWCTFSFSSGWFSGFTFFFFGFVIVCHPSDSAEIYHISYT